MPDEKQIHQLDPSVNSLGGTDRIAVQEFINNAWKTVYKTGAQLLQLVSLNTLEVTYSEAVALSQSNELQPGRFYYLTDRGYLLQAFNTGEFSKQGQRIQYCPKFYNTTVDGGNSWVGVWHASMATPNINDLTVYGALVWRNFSGNVGTSDGFRILSNDWQLVPFTDSTVYKHLVFSINYDLQEDWVSKQWDAKNNVIGLSKKEALVNMFYPVNPVDMTDWNNPNIYDNESGIISNNVLTGISVKLSRNRVKVIRNNIVGQIVENIGETILGNTCNAIRFNFTRAIIDNSAVNIDRNRVHQMDNNTVTDNIVGNIGARISSNIGSTIESNTINISVTGNTGFTQISRNVVGSINGNTVSGLITNNRVSLVTGNTALNIQDNTGRSIVNNTLSSDLTHNMCTSIDGNTAKNIKNNVGGEITNNSVSGIGAPNGNITQNNVSGSLSNNVVVGGNVAQNFGGVIQNNTGWTGINGNYVARINDNTFSIGSNPGAFGSINANTCAAISANTLSGNISNNNITGDIRRNIRDIAEPSVSIRHNSILGNIGQSGSDTTRSAPIVGVGPDGIVVAGTPLTI